MEKEMFSKVQDAVQFDNKMMFYQAYDSVESEDFQPKTAVEDSSQQLRAYQIYREKRGSTMEDWLDAERMLRNMERN